MKKYMGYLYVMIAFFSININANEKITVAAFEYPPIYQNEESKGLSCEIVIESFKTVGVDVEIIFQPVTRMVVMVADGQAMCGIGGTVLFELPEIKSKVTISLPVQYVSQGFFYSKKKFPNGINYKNLDELSGYNIGVLNGSGIMKFLEKNKSLHLDPNTIHDGSAKQLQSGRIDLWAIVDLTGIMYMNKLFAKEAVNYTYSKPFNKGDVSVVFSKKLDPNNIYKNKFMEGLAKIKKSGKYMEIMAKYYGGKEYINKESLTNDMLK